MHANRQQLPQGQTAQTVHSSLIESDQLSSDTDAARAHSVKPRCYESDGCAHLAMSFVGLIGRCRPLPSVCELGGGGAQPDTRPIERRTELRSTSTWP